MAIRSVWLGGGMHAWGACMARGVHGGGACMVGCVCTTHAPPRPDAMRYSWSMSGWYASYWNAFLLLERTSDILTFYI